MGVQQAEGDTRINRKHHKIFQEPQIFREQRVGPRHLRGATTAPQRSSPATSRTEAFPHDPASSGLTRTASAHDPESARAGRGPAEAGERDTRRERARTKVEGPRSEANGSRSEAETIGGTLLFRAELSTVTNDYMYILITWYSIATETMMALDAINRLRTSNEKRPAGRVMGSCCARAAVTPPCVVTRSDTNHCSASFPYRFSHHSCRQFPRSLKVPQRSIILELSFSVVLDFCTKRVINSLFVLKLG